MPSSLESRLLAAKQKLTRAAQGCLENRAGAAEAADHAKAEVETVLALMRAAGKESHA